MTMDQQHQITCSKCNNIYLQRQSKYFSFLICKTCLEVKKSQFEHTTWCPTPRVIQVKRTYDGSKIYAYEQCSTCGLKIKGPISQKGLNMNSLPLFDEELSNALNEEIYKEYFAIQEELGDIKKNSFFSKYEEYLNSNIWKDKRDRVLKRDNYVCQACLRNKATEVHHKTYKHVFDEPLFELTSVCRSCHEKITKMDNEKDKLYGGSGTNFFN